MGVHYTTRMAEAGDDYALSEIRVAAMQESLEAAGRFDPLRARARFLESFRPEDTTCLLVEGSLAGFYVLFENNDFFWLDHFYIHPDMQSRGLGSQVMDWLLDHTSAMFKPLRLMALKGSRSNDFYRRKGFVPWREQEWDIVYEYPPPETPPGA